MNISSKPDTIASAERIRGLSQHSNRMNSHNWLRHFTLIEMLIVIAIIGILASLLMPALNSAIEMGYTTQCLSNQRQSYFLISAYADDNGGRQPGAYIDVPKSVSPNGQIVWYQGLEPYQEVKTLSIFKCSAIKRRSEYDRYYTGGVDYTLMYYWDESVGGGMKNMRSFTATTHASQTALLFDASAYKTQTKSHGGIKYYVKPYGRISWGIDQSIGDFRHGANIVGPGWYGKPRYYDGTCSVLYLDGHAGGVHIDDNMIKLQNLRK